MKIKLILSLILSFVLVACSDDKDDAVFGYHPDLSNLQPYNSSGPYAGDIVDCVKANSIKSSCDFLTLPLISMNGTQPTIDQIMDHVVVSHAWMGDRLRSLLEIMPNDILLMLRSATAIVIDDSIRPSYYSLTTGAIYIDPAYLWLTNDEKAVISKHADFRSDYGSDLSFKTMKRYVINNQLAWQNYSLDGTEERTLNDILIPTSALFFHEMAHTNDCILPVIQAGPVPGFNYYDNIINATGGHCLQDDLFLVSHLHSQIWHNLALVLYHGYWSTADERALTPTEVGTEFATDVASEFYSFSSGWEDFAMLVEASLMKKNFNADADIAVVPYFDTFDCATALVKWGQRGRIGDPNVLVRAQMATSLVLPEVDMTTFFGSIPAPTQIPVDTSYCLIGFSPAANSFSSPENQLSTEEVRKHIENALSSQ